MSKQRIKKLRKRLWEELDGRCENCGAKTILPKEEGATSNGSQKWYMATIDHKYCRNHPERRVPTDGNVRRLFLFCRKCNQEKASIERLWEKLYPKTKLLEYECGRK